MLILVGMVLGRLASIVIDWTQEMNPNKITTITISQWDSTKTNKRDTQYTFTPLHLYTSFDQRPYTNNCKNCNMSLKEGMVSKKGKF